MSETQKIGVFIDWHIPSRSTTGPDFAPVDHWAGRLHEVCDAAIEAALKTGAAHIEIKVLSRELQLSRQFLKSAKLALNPETGTQNDFSAKSHDTRLHNDCDVGACCACAEDEKNA